MKRYSPTIRVMTIMVIDDDPEDSFVFCEVLKAIAPHIHCVAFYNFEEARKSLADTAETPAFIFLDAFMYPVGGKECLVMLNRFEKLIDTKIIIHSGALSEAQVQEFKFLGADDFIMKAGSYEALSKVLKEILPAR